MTDTRVQKFAKVLVEHSTRIKPGDRVLIEGTTAAEPLIRELFIQVLEKGGHPHPMLALPGMMPFSQDEMYVTYAKDTQLDFVPTFYKLAYDQFESRIRIHSATNTHGSGSVDPLKVQRRGKALNSITESQFRRGAEGVRQCDGAAFRRGSPSMGVKFAGRPAKDLRDGARGAKRDMRASGCAVTVDIGGPRRAGN